ncbi:hypothetical protein predicted by Glimmer/Critica [Sorangium cellulosum So ce56]|uniref:HNH nuclease domain-containing protein n=1 Tax=Sorangium cellulosum (strain So ce56) TaxID=448385 RepID=A9EVQ2_SORC5|nr:hypothetical protein [Sorangium cellulosum]CAN94246.1 hypothetical protein predicted by Glimmer/Critica [Sorangium cellulosum So ce56]
MIKIQKPAEAPETLQKAQKLVEGWKKDYKKIRKRTRARERLASFVKSIDIDSSMYAASDVKSALVRSHYGKCVFCESRILHVGHGDVEHFRPKGGFTVFDSSRASQRSDLSHDNPYIGLAYDWNNLFLACQICNQVYKKNFFDMMPDTAEAGQDLSEMDDEKRREISEKRAERAKPFEDVHDEKAVLIHPSNENPRQFIQFDPMTAEALGAKLTSSGEKGFKDEDLKTARGGGNIIALGLNRPDLLAARAKHLVYLRSLFVLAVMNVTIWKAMADVPLALDEVKYDQEDIHGDALRQLRWSTSPMAEYSALAQDAIHQWRIDLPALSVEMHGEAATAGPAEKESTVNTGNIPLPVLRLQAQNKLFNGEQDESSPQGLLQNALDAYESQRKEEDREERRRARQSLHNDYNSYAVEFNNVRTKYNRAYKNNKKDKGSLNEEFKKEISESFLDIGMLAHILECEYEYAGVDNKGSKVAERRKNLRSLCQRNAEKAKNGEPLANNAAEFIQITRR